MMRLCQRAHVISFVASWVIGALIVLTFSFLVNAESPPVLRITKVETQAFPTVKLYVYGLNLGADLAKVPLSIKENGSERDLVESTLADMGTQTALLIDASDSIRSPGVTGAARYIEISSVVNRLMERGAFSPQTDLLAAFAPTRDKQIQTVTDWTQDHGALRNALYLYEPVQGIGDTPLFELIYFALDSFGKLDPSAQRSIVLFSDGVDVKSSLEIDDAISRAIAMNVAIHTVLLGQGAPAPRGNLERIAIKTGGEFRELSSLEALDSLWDRIVAGRQQRVLVYRSQSAQPREVTVAATLPDGTARQSTVPFPVIELKPVRIEIRQPAAGQAIARQAATDETPLESMTPVSLTIQVAFAWLDGHPRELRRAEYTINNDTHLVETPPFDQFAFPIETLDQGKHTLRVVATDELGLVGQSDPFPLTVRVVRPAAPAVAPTPSAPTSEAKPIPQLYIIVAAAVLGCAVLATIVFVLVRRAQRRNRAGGMPADVIKAATVPFTPERVSKKRHATAKARLVLVEGASSLPAVIEIEGSNVRIGRDPTLSSVVLDDPRVSRYHCRIAEEGSGIFRIHDEGSTSGTYVNFAPVGIGGQILKDGDQVNVGPVGLRFELLGASWLTDGTVPFQPAFEPSAEDSDRTQSVVIQKPPEEKRS